MKNLYLIFFLLFMFSKISFAAEDQRRQIYTPPPSTPPKVTTSDIPKLVQVQAPLPKYPDPSIVEVQRQLQDIVQIRQSVQMLQQRDIQEIQRITEQAQLHQRILEDLSAAKTPGQNEAVEEAIRRQKIELIEKQASKNIEILEELKKKDKGKKKEKDKDKGKKKEKIKSEELMKTVAEKPVEQPEEQPKAELLEVQKPPQVQEPPPSEAPTQQKPPQKQKKPWWWWNSPQ